MYPVECGQQLGRDPAKIGSSKSLVLKSFYGHGTQWDSSLLVSLTLRDTPVIFLRPYFPSPNLRTQSPRARFRQKRFANTGDNRSENSAMFLLCRFSSSYLQKKRPQKTQKNHIPRDMKQKSFTAETLGTGGWPTRFSLKSAQCS